MDNNEDCLLLLKVEKILRGNKNDRILGDVITMECNAELVHPILKVLVFKKINNQSAKLKVDQQIWLRGRLVKIENNRGILSFNWQDYYKRIGVEHSMYNPDIRLVESENEGIDITSRIKKIRQYLVSIIVGSEWEKTTGQIVCAMLLGDKSTMDIKLKNAFAASGVVHVLAVSGLHVGIIYLFIRFICSLFGLSKKQGFGYVLVVLVSIWSFAFLTGLSSSVVRAAFMFSLIVIAEVVKRESSIYNTIACSAFFILLFDHNRLFDLGFQLSYLAVVGIISIYPILNKLVSVRNTILQRVMQMTFVSIAAQISTLPLILYYFGMFPLYFLFGNLIAIPVTSIIVVFSLVYITCVLVLKDGLIVEYLTRLLDLIVQLFQKFILFISELPQAQQYIKIDEVGLVICSMALILLISSFYKASKRYLWLSLISICFLVLYRSTNQLFNLRQFKIHLIAVDNKLLISSILNNGHIIVKLEDEEYSGLEHCLRNYQKIEKLISIPTEHSIDSDFNQLVCFKSDSQTKRYLIINKISMIPKNFSELKRKVDAIIITDTINQFALMEIENTYGGPIFLKKINESIFHKIKGKEDKTQFRVIENLNYSNLIN